MSEPNKKNPEGDETTILHFNKFTSEQPSPSPEETATIFIKKAATETVQQGSTRVVVPSAAGPLSPEEMLGAVAYCYAKGVYSSSDIERKMLQDPEFREALGDFVPDPRAIRRFRKLNRAAIQEVLEKFYRRLRKQKPPTEVLPGAKPPEPAPASPPLAAGTTPASSNPGESTAFFVKREASERLDKATFIDGMSQDT
jgi:hypothetical protein